MSNSDSFGIQLSDRCGLGDSLNTVETPKKEFPSIARKLRERQMQRLRSTWAGFTVQQRKKRLYEEEQKLTVFCLPPLYLAQQKQVEDAIESPKPKSVKITSTAETTKSLSSPLEVPTTMVVEDQPPLVIPASPIAEPMEDSPPTASAFQSLPTPPTVFNAFQTGQTVDFPQTSHQDPSHQVSHLAADQLRRRVKVNRNRRFDELEGPPGEVQRRQTFADFGQPEMQNQFQYTEHRPSAPVMPVQEVQIPPAPPRPTWDIQPMQQFQQPAPSFAPTPQEVAPVPGFSIGRAATPKRGHTKQRNRRIRR